MHRTILLSDRFVSTLPADALDQIVLHEQAHLTRFDDWTRLAQAGITALLGLHPAIRFIDTQIDLEREAACDDIVVARTGGAARYASCLAQAADAVGFGPRQRPGALTPNVTGHGNLFVRVQRLLDPRMPRHARLQFASAATGLVALTAAATIGPIAPLVVIRGATAQPPAVYGEPGTHAFDWQSRAAGLPLLESPVGRVDNLSDDRVETDEVFHEQARVGSDARAMVTTPDAGTPSGDYLPIVDASADEPAGEPVPLRSRTLTSTAFPAPAIPVGTPGPPGGHESGWKCGGPDGSSHRRWLHPHGHGHGRNDETSRRRGRRILQPRWKGRGRQLLSTFWNATSFTDLCARAFPRFVGGFAMRVFLVNPSHVSFGTAVITPRWLFVLAAATPRQYGDPIICDETLDPFDPNEIAAGDVVGIGIHTGNALRGYEVGKAARERGAQVVFGGIHATLYPTEPHALGGAHAVVRGDGDLMWGSVIADCAEGHPKLVYEAGRVSGDTFKAARWDLLPKDRYMWASIQTVRGCPKHCSFCSVWRTDGQEPRQSAVDSVIGEAVELRRRGFRFIALADDNFYPVSLADLAQAKRRTDDGHHLRELEAIRAERFLLMEKLSHLPNDMVFYTQITMEAAEDPAFLEAMVKARIKGALIGVEAVTPEGLKDVYKGFNLTGEALVERLQTFKKYGVHVLGSFIFGLPSDRPGTFEATAALAERAGVTFAQFVMLTPFPGTVDFEKWERDQAGQAVTIAGVPITRHWLIPQANRPKVYTPHPVMSADEIRDRTQAAWDHFYALPRIWERAKVVRSWKGRLMFVLISKLYRRMYANTGIATDSARTSRSVTVARWLARPCRKLFQGAPMPELQMP